MSAGVGVVILSDFGVSEQMINTVFLGSGCLGSLEDVRRARFFTPNPDWMADNYFHAGADCTWLDELTALLDRRSRTGLTANPMPGSDCAGHGVGFVGSVGGWSAGEHSVAQLPDCPLTTCRGQRQPRCATHLRTCVSHRNRPPHHRHGWKIIDVVTDIDGAFSGDVMVVEPLPQGRSLVVDALPDVHT